MNSTEIHDDYIARFPVSMSQSCRAPAPGASIVAIRSTRAAQNFRPMRQFLQQGRGAHFRNMSRRLLQAARQRRATPESFVPASLPPRQPDPSFNSTRTVRDIRLRGAREFPFLSHQVNTVGQHECAPEIPKLSR